ncbi:MAG TPA: hypothetical protein VNO55_04560 [Polyangia bacterium]|nr:hypothetical protein [Polyangia bacterium]
MTAAALVLSAGCGGDGPPGLDLGAAQSAVTVAEDGLADAYALFKQNFVAVGFDRQFRMGFGFHPGLSTEKLPAHPQNGQPPAGSVTFDFTTSTVNATLQGAPAGSSFDLWLVKNVAGGGRTMRPETGDTFFKVATFAPARSDMGCFGAPGCVEIDNKNLGSNINFDLDLVVVTRKDQHPTVSRIAVGARGLFEKRFFREKAGRTLDPVSGTVANNVETTDALVGRGAQLFFNETFGGNGRTCGTCHRAENNLTIDPPFIATLPQSDPLFVAENNTALAPLEDRTLLRTRALIRENVDGFDDPTHKFVARSVNHTFALGLTSSTIAAAGFFPFSPPDQPLGWSGDGAPGRGTLHEFGFGAVVQHFTKDLARRPGTDFRIPTQEELDALEAFQLFTGRQKNVILDNVRFREDPATRGRDLFTSGAACGGCHLDFQQTLSNSSFDTAVARLTPDLPLDNGFQNGTSGLGFNVPPIIEAVDTAPLFHNNAAADIEAAIAFYMSDTFRSSPVGRFFFMNFDANQQADIAAFLRVINAAENIRQIRKKVQFVKNTRSTGNTSLLTVAIADTQDAIDDLAAKGLNAAAVNELKDVKQTLQIAQANADADRGGFMDHALTFLNLARGELFTANPDNQF